MPSQECIIHFLNWSLVHVSLYEFLIPTNHRISSITSPGITCTLYSLETIKVDQPAVVKVNQPAMVNQHCIECHLLHVWQQLQLALK